jgi:hypothetical protein
VTLTVALALAAPARGQQGPEALPDVQQLREQLNRRESERGGMSADAQQLSGQLNQREKARRDIEAERPFGWEENFRPFDLKFDASADRKNGIVELRYEARELPCFVVLEREGGDGAKRVQAPMVVPGSQWVRLERGTWNVRLFAGFATGPVVEFPASPVEVAAGKVYQLTFGTEEEIAARDKVRDAARERNEKRAERSVTVSPR